MKPVIALTTGDPSGIGPEICLKAAALPRVLQSCRPLLVGDQAHLLETARTIPGLPDPSGWPEVSRPAFAEIGSKQGAEGEVEGWADGPAFHDMADLEPLPEIPGPSAAGGRAAVKYIKQAVGLVRFGSAAAIVTAPISKTALRLAGVPYPGHTELLADLCGAELEEVAMLFVAPDLKVALLSVHESLRDAIALLSRERVAARLALLRAEHRRWFGAEPRIGLCALNPHAGEEGMFGKEEQEILAPAAEAARASGCDVRGPLPADTLFARAARGEFDLVLALHHDQGTIAVKSRAFGGAVNMTLGLPLLRTSVDHGTAYDIAGKGIADPSSLAEAILLATRLAPRARAAHPQRP
ncbi:MAG TPA: 4-hydroxythreonine-4-phosphate dehydrogenase PdxA [Candidatus Cryosericum sp.]|nr:4-hydroxythreonine-4-phosphate dehydrogenase PdxA [Candidatus Cryosericum sp.]